MDKLTFATLWLIQRERERERERAEVDSLQRFLLLSDDESTLIHEDNCDSFQSKIGRFDFTFDYERETEKHRK